MHLTRTAINSRRAAFSKHLRCSFALAVGLTAGMMTTAASASPAADEPLADERTQALEPLPEKELFEWLIADPREAIFSVRYLNSYAIEDEGFAEEHNAAAVSLGEYFGLLQGRSGLGRWQLGLEAAVFALFALDSPSANLANADYRVGVPLTARSDRWSYRVNLYHQSSHLGDEFLLQHPVVERVNLSFEAVEALIAHHWQGLRPYVGGGYIIRSDQDLEPGMLQYGIDYRRSAVLGPFDLVAGVNVRRDEEQDWERSRLFRLGLDYSMNDGRSVALLLEHFDGFSPTGQFLNVPIEYTGIGLYFRL
jgi:hypothetical protein